MRKIIIIGFVLLIGVLGIYVFIDSSLSIKLKGKKIVETNYNKKYQELGYKASLIGQDLSKKVTIKGKINTKKIGTYKLIYQINYMFSKKKVTRTVKVVDKEKPVITLNGSDNMVVKLNSEYKEPGYVIKDNVNNDLKVDIEGTVDTKKVGEYVLVYKVKDKSGNETKVKRIVKVEDITINKRGIPVLMYHYFYDKNNPPKNKKIDGNYMEIKDFENQLKYLKDSGFYFPSWEELYKYVKGEIDLPLKSVVITSDDGAKSFFTLAIPLANKYKVPITSFFIASRKQEINSYKSDYVHFESHTYDMHHAGCKGGRGGIFWCIDESRGIADLKKAMEIVGSDYALAYPYGDVNDNIKNITKKSGVKMAFTTKNGYVKPNMDLLELPRIRMSKGVSLESFKKMVG